MEVNRLLDSHFDLPPADLPDLSGGRRGECCRSPAVAVGLGMRRAPNMVHLLEVHGVRVFSLAEENEEVDAFSYWHRDTPFVFLNTRTERSRMDAAHELGHLVLHRTDPRQGRTAEDEAQTFAVAFLMPAATVIAEAPRGGRLPQLIKAKRRWNVAVVNLAYRMQRVGMLTEWEARQTFIAIGRAGYRTTEPESIPRERSQVLDKVFAALREEGHRRRGRRPVNHIPTGSPARRPPRTPPPTSDDPVRSLSHARLQSPLEPSNRLHAHRCWPFGAGGGVVVTGGR